MSLSLSSTRSFDNSFSAFERFAYFVKHSYGVGVEVKTHVNYYLLEIPTPKKTQTKTRLDGACTSRLCRKAIVFVCFQHTHPYKDNK